MEQVSISQVNNQTNTLNATDRAARIRELNDIFRKNPFVGRGRFFVTIGIAGVPDEDRRAILDTVFAFEDFNEGNDPHGEHDFGSFILKGRKIFWKIDYYAKDTEHGSDDPSDPDKTCRVLTIMLASEY